MPAVCSGRFGEGYEQWMRPIKKSTGFLYYNTIYVEIKIYIAH